MEAGNVGHLNHVSNAPWALRAMNIVSPIQSLVDNDSFFKL